MFGSIMQECRTYVEPERHLTSLTAVDESKMSTAAHVAQHSLRADAKARKQVFKPVVSNAFDLRWSALRSSKMHELTSVQACFACTR